MSQITLQISVAELEELVRRVVREEFERLLHRSTSILEDSSHEGPDVPEEDGALLEEALMTLQRPADQAGAWINWEDFEAEMDRAEANGELPD